ncbi:winged helix-turn-helix domain-containing protein [Candidatus Pelagibacter sp.]|nr:winged helix-turn-helix domain-containing protein [Candidatus Pelagibacter sp.]
MNNQNLLIYQYPYLSEIMCELEDYLNLKIIEISNQKNLLDQIKLIPNHLILTKKQIPKTKNYLIINDKPIKISILIEKINIQLLKQKFNDQSEIIINSYKINLNSREIFQGDKKLKLTEKEIQTLIYLSNSKKPITSEELQSKVWRYQKDLETHTVETHIYRLRKKFLNFFNDNNFIISNKNGYKIK